VEIDRRIADIEARLGKRLIVREVRTPERTLRGRVEVRASTVLIDYCAELPGYFWGYELLEELLDWVEGEGRSACFYEHNGRLLRIPAIIAEPEGRDE